MCTKPLLNYPHPHARVCVCVRALERAPCPSPPLLPVPPKVGVLTGVFVVVLTVNLLKGGGAFPSPLGIKCGSYAFWGATVFIFVWVLGVSL